MELNSGLTAFADNQSDGSKSHIERYHRYDFDTKEESIEEIIVETNSFTDGETTAGYFPNGKIATVYKGNIIKNLIMDCQSYTKYRPNETTGGIFVSWRRKEELPTGA